MGGYGSGRPRTRNRGAVENHLGLDIRALRRRGYIKPGFVVSGVWRWTLGGEPSDSVELTCDLTAPSRAAVELQFAANGMARTQRVVLQARACRYGGHRFYFLCPQRGAPCEVLLCVDGVFASRQEHGLVYASQTQVPLDRLLGVRDKAAARLRGRGGLPIPRGANRQRVNARMAAAEAALDEAENAMSLKYSGAEPIP